ncbi:MAG: LuxR C-terminal-related transcriptional regulator [Hyphomonas sp.]|uniref:helix-turn-helix transcriptional regulator n=1 Tax=Hyphomonas sp. TaxID=87 RepID=UPI003528AFB0
MLNLLRAMLKADSVFSLRDATMAGFEALGFRHAYFVSPIVHDRNEGRFLTNIGFPAEWEKAHREELRKLDPLPDIALRIGRPFRWGALPPEAQVQPAEADYIAGLAKWGLEDGIGIPAYGSAARVGFVGLGGPIRQNGFDMADMELLRIAGETSYLRYCELIVQEAADGPRLSSRELDVLHWMAQGKSNAAIAKILNVGSETVDTYARRIYSKLGVSDRTSAVIKGVTRGFVVASEPKIDDAIRARQPKGGPS